MKNIADLSISEKLLILKNHDIQLDQAGYEANNSKTVIVGMSGGVDSSVTALIIKLMGYKTIGMFMKNWEEIDADGVCSAEEDYKDVIAVSEKLDIPYYSINLSEEYKENVFKYFVEEYEAGHTPNPDILCNREIKFKVFYEKAKEFGADFLATGHYCRHENRDGLAKLVKGVDQNKDQTYFLYTMQSDVLKDVLFPVGQLEKKYVRSLAEEFDLITFDKKDSTGICFIGERNFKLFLSNYIKSQKGQFVHLDTGKVLGEHDGMCFYTNGQRKGLGLGGPGGPWFVAFKDVTQNIVYVVEGQEHPALYADELTASEESWVGDRPSFPLKLKAKIRYRQQDQECTVFEKDGELSVCFDKPQRAISQRQSIVFYQDDICLGGAIIQKAGPSYFEMKKNLS